VSTPAADEERVPAHVAWVAADAHAPAAAPSGDRGALEGREDRALLALVDAAAQMGVAWLTVQEPSGGRVLRERSGELAARGVWVLGWPDLEPLAGPAPDPVAPGRRVRRAGAGPVPAAGSTSALRVLAAPPASGRAGLVDAVRRLADEGVPPKRIDEKAIGAALGVPDVDLLVVTGGDRSVPDLLIWQVAYSEIVFLPDPWPRAGHAELTKAVEEYRRRDRRYGGLVVSR
jgi:undecaprenyl pyrophosphate synthase